MSTRLARYCLGSFWMNTLALSLAFFSFGVGFQLVLPYAEWTWESVRDLFWNLFPLLPAPILFLAAAVTVGRIQWEGSLVSVAGAGKPVRAIGWWLLLGAAPFVILAQVIEAFPVHAADRDKLLARQDAFRLRDGGSIFIEGAGDDEDRSEPPAIVLLPDQERVHFGRRLEPRPDQGVESGWIDGQTRVALRESWDLASSSVARFEGADSELWTGSQLAIPRAVIWGPTAYSLDLFSLQRWVEREPWRNDLRFARDSKLRAGLRIYVLLLLGFGFWLRPGRERLVRRNTSAMILAATYLVVEVWCASMGAAGDVASPVAAFGPGVVFGGIGLLRWRFSDRPE